MLGIHAIYPGSTTTTTTTKLDSLISRPLQLARSKRKTPRWSYTSGGREIRRAHLRPRRAQGSRLLHLPYAVCTKDSTLRILITSCLQPPSTSSSAQRTKSRIARLANSTPQPTLFKATDNLTGQIIGIAHWTIHTDDEEITHSVTDAVTDIVNASIPEMNRDAVRGFYTMVTEGKRDVLRVDVPVRDVYGRRGKTSPVVKLTRRVELETVFVHPTYRRRGVASALVEWGIEQAERLGLLVYLEATEEGRGVYERVGFESVRGEWSDARVFDREGGCEYTFMVRRPTGMIAD